MNKSILILEENSVIHGLVGSALDLDGVTLHHEFNPEHFVERAKSLLPDLILISNADQQSDYAITREIKQGESLADVPLILLASSKEQLDSGTLRELQVNGVVRKPFEASDLQQQVSKHLNLIDLVGAAYEYKKSQSIEEQADPLADLRVVDSEVLSLLQESAEGAAGPAPEVPQVDFSPMLEEDGSDYLIDEETLAETLQPEAAFEPIKGSGGDEDAAETLTLGAQPAGEEEFVELGPADLPEEEIVELGPADLLEEEIEELGPADLLEEESEGDAGPEPAGLDQSLETEAQEGAGQALADTPLDEIEVELPEGELDLAGLGEELEQTGVDLFAAGEPEVDEGEDVPLAVRRMMELRPVFSHDAEGDAPPAGDGGAGEDVSLVAEAGALAPDDDLGTVEEIDLMQTPIFEDEPDVTAGAQTAEVAPTPTPFPPQEEEMEEFHEDLLGDDEIDEDKILEAMQAAEAESAAEEEAALEDFQAFDGLESEESEMDELVALAELQEETAPAEDGVGEAEELLLDQDEEAMMLSALEEDESFNGAMGKESPPAAVEPTLELPPEPEAEPTLELPPEPEAEPTLELPPEPEAQPFEDLEAGIVGELDDLEQAVAGESGDTPPRAETLEGSLEELRDEPVVLEESEESLREAAMEMGLEEAAEPTELGLGAEAGLAEGDGSAEEFLELPEEGGSGLVDAIAAEGAQEPSGTGVAKMEGLGDELELEPLQDTGAAEEETPMDFIEDDLGEEAMSGAEEQETLENDVEDALDEFASFKDELLGLKAEIEANPEGERLDDVLEQEGVKAAVADLDIGLPQRETNLTRAMGVSELPEGGPETSAAAEAIDEPTFAEPLPEGEPEAAEAMPTLDLADAVLDEEVRAKLGEVLDEIITISVRKAVKEEMPKLLEQLMKEKQST